MNDILERLEAGIRDETQTSGELLQTAKDEIESLRAKVLKWEAQAKRWKNVALKEDEFGR